MTFAKTQSAPSLIDQDARDAFIGNIDCNYSVIAPAGVGKTTAITRRIAQMALKDPEQLSKLVVVTYTQKAAAEMEERVRAEVLSMAPTQAVLKHLSQAFFGTIHSFCLNLIRGYGHELGLIRNFEIVGNDDELWDEFLRNHDALSESIEAEALKELKKFINLSKIFWLARKLRLDGKDGEIGEIPWVDLAPILEFPEAGRTAKSIIKHKGTISAWFERLGSADEAIGVPAIRSGGAEFLETWAGVTRSLWEWSGATAVVLANRIGEAYRSYRAERGLLSYDDLIYYASTLVDNGAVLRSLQEEGYRIILDEAQDTDQAQFKLLLNLAKQKGVLRPGHFCMVGDPQQSIYSSRADLPSYLKTHEHLIDSGDAEALTFQVTMRCSEAVVTHANEVFPSVMGGTDYVPLQAKPKALVGNVIRYDLLEAGEDLTTAQEREVYEATQVAEWIQSMGLQGFGLSDWSDAALLAPRKSWLMALEAGLNGVGIKTQVHSTDTLHGDNPGFAWITALLIVTCEPWNAHEVMGILREVYGLSDAVIADYVRNHYAENSLHPLALNGEFRDGAVGEVLKELWELVQTVPGKSISCVLECIIEGTGLKSRIGTVAGEAGVQVLDDVILRGVEAEEQGESLQGFTQSLREVYFQPISTSAKKLGHVQLLTSHKSKGLEWDTVILPFLFRPVRYPVQEYPQVFQTTADSAPKVALFDHLEKKGFAEALARYREMELRRLLYVTATRAKRNLVYINDYKLYSEDRGDSFGSLLGAESGGINAASWSRLGQEMAHEPVASKEEPEAMELMELQQVALNTKKRVLPSSLVSHKREEKPEAEGGIDYGNWWHKVMETHAWGEPLDIDNALTSCSHPERGGRELGRFLESGLYQRLLSMEVETELPFLHPKKGAVIEGIIDLLALDPTRKVALIVDWKTDAVGEDGVLLEEIYAKQLDAYREAVQYHYPGWTVEAVIYSTAGSMKE